MGSRSKHGYLDGKPDPNSIEDLNSQEAFRRPKKLVAKSKTRRPAIKRINRTRRDPKSFPQSESEDGN